MDGYLKVYPGGMGGQKTSHAILDLQRIRDGTNYDFLAFKPHNSLRPGIDDDSSSLVSRTGIRLEAVVVDEHNPNQILDNLQRRHQFVLIDEAHMFPGFGLQPVIEKLLDRHVGIHAAFLIKDYGDRPFPISVHLLSVATHCDKFYFGVCKHPGCTNPGSCSQLLVNGDIAKYAGPDASIITGDIKKGNIQYLPLCQVHYIRPENHLGYKESL